MTNVDLARWQFAFVTVNHFFFVPATIGLAFLTALLQTAWYRSKREEYLRLTRFSVSCCNARPWPGRQEKPMSADDNPGAMRVFPRAAADRA
jgi:hypothetical protein